MEGIIFIAYFALVVVVIWKIFVLVGDMAERRGQDRLLWQVAALFINPIGAILLLWLFCTVKSNHIPR